MRNLVAPELARGLGFPVLAGPARAGAPPRTSPAAQRIGKACRQAPGTGRPEQPYATP